MKLIEVKFTLDGADSTLLDTLPYRLESLGFEGFADYGVSVSAYIPVAIYDRTKLVKFLGELGLTDDCFKEILVPDINWNEEWEKNFEPVLINNQCYIRAPFHQPCDSYPYEIIIEPKMSFGTGHHATTSLMLSEMMDIDLNDKQILDAGTGTGILSIFAEKLGSRNIVAIDIDEWSFKNARENISLNSSSKIDVLLGDIANFIELKPNEGFDCILANINLNIIKANLNAYSKLCYTGGYLLMSGILTTDIDSLKKDTEKFNFIFELGKSLNNWAVVRFRKI
jgi:ribosomal protein L11 methyltransferase